MVTENPTSSRSHRRALSMELNLVPFIDLLSTLVLFLLVTAVWVQVSVVPASVKSGEGKAESAGAPPSSLKVHLTADSIEMIWPESLGNLTESLEKKDDSFPWEELATKVKGQIASVTATLLSSEVGVPYGQVIRAIDTLKEAGSSNVSLRTE